jgi:dipeptidyl aminopeptidase/acylaminoacyl peptidase
VVQTLCATLFVICLHGPTGCAVSPSTDSANASPAENPTTLVYPPFGHCLGMHRVGPFHLFVYLGSQTRFDNPTGIVAVKLRSENDPSTERDDDELTVFGLNSGRCEIIYNTSLYNIEVFGTCGDGDGEFRNPLGITADEDGNVFVADTGNNRVVRLLYRNDRLLFIKSFGFAGDDGGAFSVPSQIALGASGTLYIADTGNDRIVLMSSVGEYLGEIRQVPSPDASLDESPQPDASLDRPVGLAVVERRADWTSRTEDSIVVADRSGTRLLRFDRNGKLLARADTRQLPGTASFDYLAIDYYGNVYATDRAGCRIHKFDRFLNHVTSFGQSGKGDMELDEPRGITLWRRFGQIFVAETEGAQYFWIGTDIQRFSVEPASLVEGEGKLRVSYFLTEVARVTLEVLDQDNKVVRTIVSNRRRAMGENVEHWDATRLDRKSPQRKPVPQDPEPLQPGRYTVRLTATPTYSSGDYFSDTAESHLKVTR